MIEAQIGIGAIILGYIICIILTIIDNIKKRYKRKERYRPMKK